MDNLLVDNQYKIKKRPEKFGWHYVELIEIDHSQRNKQGLVRVKGTVDNYSISQFNLLPLKQGGMLLPIMTEIRKKILKKEGDLVQIQLFSDDSKVEIPLEILESLEQSAKALSFFNSLSESNQKDYINWIQKAKRPETQVERMLKTIEKLEKGIRFWDWPMKQ
jgi:hypothetical protein